MSQFDKNERKALKQYLNAGPEQKKKMAADPAMQVVLNKFKAAPDSMKEQLTKELTMSPPTPGYRSPRPQL